MEPEDEMDDRMYKFDNSLMSYQPRTLRDKVPSSAGGKIYLWHTGQQHSSSSSHNASTSALGKEQTPADDVGDDVLAQDVLQRPPSLRLKSVVSNGHDEAYSAGRAARIRKRQSADWYDKLVGPAAAETERDAQLTEVISRATALFARGLITATELNKICDRGNFSPVTAPAPVERAKLNHDQIDMLQAFDERSTGVWLNLLGCPPDLARDLVYASVSIFELQDFTDKDFRDFGIDPALQRVLKMAAHAYTFTPTLRGDRMRRWLSRGAGISAKMAERMANSGLCGGDLLDMSLSQLRAFAISSCYETDLTVLNSYQSLISILSALRDQRRAAAKIQKGNTPPTNMEPSREISAIEDNPTTASKSEPEPVEVGPPVPPRGRRDTLQRVPKPKMMAHDVVEKDRGRLLLQAAHSNTSLATAVAEVAAVAATVRRESFALLGDDDDFPLPSSPILRERR